MSGETSPTSARILAVFAKELAAVGFSQSLIDALLVKALEHELRTGGLNIYSLDEDDDG